MDEKNHPVDIFKTVADFSPAWLMWLTDEKTVAYASPATKTITGYEPREFMDDPGLLQKILHPEERGKIFLEFADAAGETHDQALEFRIVRKDGSVRWISHRCRLAFDDNNKRVGRISSNTDVTERKLKESALLEKEKLLQSIFDGMPDPAHIIDRDYRVVLANKRMLDLKNLRQEEIAGKHCYEVYQQRAGRCESCASKEVFATGNPCSLMNTLPSPDGTFRYFEVFAFPLRAPDGEVAQVVEMTRDITDRRAALRDMQKMARIVEQAAETIAITDTKGNLEYVNPAFEKITGYPAAEVLAKNSRILKGGGQPPDFFEELWNTIARGDIWRGVFINKKKNGATYYEDAEIFPLKDDSGAIVNYVKIARDITELKNMEDRLRQSQKMEAVGTLAGGVAHDFNNLLTAINGYAELAMLKIDDKERLRHYIFSIQEAGGKARKITSQLLAFSRKQIYQPEMLDINHVVSSLDNMLRRLIGEDINMETFFGENLPKIKGDETQLEQIYVNLAVNARDALNEVKKTDFVKKITIETEEVFIDDPYVLKHPESRKGQYIVFSISDNGIGMDETTRQRVFEPFFTTKEKHKGTGLGLAMVYGIVKQNNGFIYLYSELGQGTTFKIYWPAAKEEDEDTAPKTAVVEDDISEGNETILVVEDYEAVRGFACESLSSLGYTVHEAENGRVALELVKNGSVKFDLIITDLMMPELGGREFVEKARQSDPDFKVIYTSGHTANHIVHEGMLEKGIDFLQKPYSITALANAVRKALR